jgi:hypothetical protein
MRLLAALVAVGCTGELVGSAPLLPDASGPGGGGGDGDAASSPQPETPDAAPPGPDPFTLDVLHEVDITVDPVYWDALENDTENRIPCTFVFDGETLENVGIRKKGGIGSVSSLNDKPGFSLKFNEFVMGQRLGPVRRLILNNAIQDPTLLSEHLGYEIARRAGLAAPRTSHARVTLNQRTLGIYVVKEAINKDFLAPAFGNGDGNLYEGPYGADFGTAPETLELKDELEEMRTRDDLFAFAAGFAAVPDTGLRDYLAARLDLPAFLTFYAVDAATNHWDGYAYNINNYYLYHRPSDDRFVPIHHGMDQLFQDLGFDPQTFPNGSVTARLRSVPELDAEFRTALAAVAASWDVAALQARVDQAAVVIRSASGQTDERTQSDLAVFEGFLEGVRGGVAQRRAVLGP